MRLIVYSHDTYGLGNTRRMLAICKYLLDTVPTLSILLISGSPVVHSFRMPPGLDYIKLPCLGRNESGQLSARYLGTNLQEAAKLRSEIIKTSVINFAPNLILVDKKPYGLQGELKDTLAYLKKSDFPTKLVLLLRDILDTPEATCKEWQENAYYEAIDRHYDQILVVGMPEIFNVIQEYQFPYPIAQKTKFCGYIRREHGFKSPAVIRQELKVQSDEKLVLVTPGGGGDGYQLVETYLQSIMQLSGRQKLKSLIFSGTEMPCDRQQKLAQLIKPLPQIKLAEFTDDLTSYMNAADTIVSMGGYNTICEVMSLGKRAIVIPRIKPGQEQWIRAKRMAELGICIAIHPDYLTPQHLSNVLLKQLNSQPTHLNPITRLDLNALPRIQQYLCELIFKEAAYNVSISPNLTITKKPLFSRNQLNLEVTIG